MPLRKHVKFRFFLLPTLVLATFLIILTSVTVAISMARFEDMAEESTTAIFSLIAQRNADQLNNTMAGARLAVGSLSRLQGQRLVSQSRVNQVALVPALSASLRANPDAYSFYYAFETGEFLQVIGVRRDPRILQALDAPAGTYFAIRFIGIDTASPDRPRESWQFQGENGAILAQSVREAEYAPRTRAWYASAIGNDDLQVTDPYQYESLQEMGITLSQALDGGLGVFGADLALGSLDAYASGSLEDREGGVVITDHNGNALAAHSAPRFGGDALTRLDSLKSTSNPFFAEAGRWLADDSSGIASIDGEKFAYASRSVEISPRRSLHIVAFSPMDVYTGPIGRARSDMLLFSGVILLLFLPLAYFLSRRIASALGALTRESERIQRGDFGGEQAVRSLFYEIDLLGRAQHTMKATLRERAGALQAAMANLENLVASGLQLSSRRSRQALLQQTADGARGMAGAYASQLWLYGAGDVLEQAASSGPIPTPEPAPALATPDPATRSRSPCAWVAEHRQPLQLEPDDPRFDRDEQRRLAGDMPRPLALLPILVRGDKLLGILVLVGTPPAPSPAFDAGTIRYAGTLAAQSGVALDNIALMESQGELMESLIKLVAGAIDAKSAYTAGHCARVPELARMLAEAACEVDHGPLADFRFKSEDEWREFRIGSWLHDCGKVTTPEYVVDKATKLETIYNRVHEIRMRFEVLLRDAQIARLTAIAAGTPAAAADADLAATQARLADDFAFVAECNIGGEFMKPADRDRLGRIAAQTWQRHFDDRLGLSRGEEARLADIAPKALPTTEQLLADKAEHRVPRTAEQHYDPRYRFDMTVPHDLYNFGELHNLGIERGTLSPEERYKINEHIVQTVVMLDQLPLPENLRRVPEYASTHHETLTGTGYPRKLSAKDLSIPSRVMAIADIFEALTASDRPYKKAKSLSEAVRILSFFKKDRHIDGDLFDLFLTSGVYLQYAQMFLAPEQIDDVDISAYVQVV